LCKQGGGDSQRANFSAAEVNLIYTLAAIAQLFLPF
jgi:hypothetical protein